MRNLYAALNEHFSMTHRSAMQPASLRVCTLPHALSVCIRALGHGLAVYLGMKPVGGEGGLWLSFGDRCKVMFDQFDPKIITGFQRLPL